MGFSFRVELGSRRPAFSQLLQPAPLLVGAGPEKDRWPTGLLQRVPDLSSRPCSLRLPEALLALYTRAEFSGSFLATVPARSTRGVEVSWQKGSVVFRVPVFGSLEDYELAVRLAAAAARAGAVPVWPEHGPEGQPIGSVQPDALPRFFDAKFAARHLEATSAQVVAANEPLFCFGPRGWVPVAASLEATMQALGSPSPTPLESPTTLATLLTRAMLFVGEANGALTGEKAVQLRATLLLDSDLRGFDFEVLLNEANASRELGGLPEPLRVKALIIATEVAAAAQTHGKPSDDSTSAAVGALALALEVPEAEAVLRDARACFAAKFAALPDAAKPSAVEAVLLAAMSDGQIDPLELGTCLATFQTQAIAPELVPVAEARILKDMAEVVAGFEGLGEARNQVFVIAAEVAFANGGLTPRAQAALRQLRDWLKPDDFVVESALATFSRKSR